MASDKKVGMGVIGYGVIGEFHALGVSRSADARLVGVCDIEEVRRAKAKENYTCEVYEDYRAILERKDLDAVCICTPSGMHGDMTIAAAQAGKHVLTEKPMDITLDKCDQMIAACKQAGVLLGVIFQNRFNEGVTRIKQAIDQGKLGKLILGDAVVKWYRTQEYYDTGGWRGTWKLDGGGALMNQSVHYIDLLQWMMGPVAEVYAHTATAGHKIEVEDLGVAVLRFQSGAVGTITGTTCAYPGVATRLEVHGTQGSIMWDEGNIARWEIMGQEKPETAEDMRTAIAAHPTMMPAEPHRRQIEQFAQAILAGGTPAVTGEEGRKAVEIVLAIYQSGRTGQPVTLPLR